MFTNLIETDQVYGHRHDFAGFERALVEIDGRVRGWLSQLRDDDLLVLTADHGCDLTSPHTDHTREHVPLLARFAGHGSRRHDGPLADVGASVLDWLTGDGRRRAARPFLHPARTGRPPLPDHGALKCPSCPRSRRSAASWRPHLEGRTIMEAEILDPRWTRPDPPGRCASSCADDSWSASGATASTWSGSCRETCTC